MTWLKTFFGKAKTLTQDLKVAIHYTADDSLCQVSVNRVY